MQNRLTSDWRPSTDDAADGWDAQPDSRLRWLAVLLLLPLAVIAVRVIDLQVRLPEKFLAAFPPQTERLEEIPAHDGRILASDGTVLADDVVTYDLLVHYRWLESPPDRQWLRRKAWDRLSRAERRQPGMVAAQEDLLRQQRDAAWDRLADLTGLPRTALNDRALQIQHRVERVRQSVADRRDQQPAPSAAVPMATAAAWWQRWWLAVQQELASPPARPSDDPLIIQEQESYHLLAADLTRDQADDVQAHPEHYPGVRVRPRSRRTYPLGDVAAHLLGVRTALKPDEQVPTYQPGDLLGRGGLERQYDADLHGIRGRQTIVVDRQGEIVSTTVVEPPHMGRDVTLTLDLRLQRAGERLLDLATQRTPSSAPAEDENPTAAPQPPVGGCLIALDVHTGAILAAACAPRFDVNLLIDGDQAAWQKLLADPRKPLFPRVTQMAVPPGSVFKAITAAALLAEGLVTPDTTIDCQGYLDHPGQHRCLIYRHYGLGHGPTDLAAALARSCNVYFFTGARRAGPRTLVDWAAKFGIGQPTGLDLPGEAAGYLPRPDGPRRKWYPGDTLGLAIGQSSLTVTPLQMARMMAAIANGGQLVTPHLVMARGSTSLATDSAVPLFQHPPATPIPGLEPEWLASIREGLFQVVNDPHGTAYKTARRKDVAYAGKTGTAEVGGQRPDHAWFAGFAPADEPRVAFAIVMEHGGSGGKVAGPVAKAFVGLLVDQA